MTPETIELVAKVAEYVATKFLNRLLGKLEMLRAIGEVLDERNALNTPPATVLVWYEDNCKLQRPITVF